MSNDNPTKTKKQTTQKMKTKKKKTGQGGEAQEELRSRSSIVSDPHDEARSPVPLPLHLEGHGALHLEHTSRSEGFASVSNTGGAVARRAAPLGAAGVRGLEARARPRGDREDARRGTGRGGAGRGQARGQGRGGGEGAEGERRRRRRRGRRRKQWRRWRKRSAVNRKKKREEKLGFVKTEIIAHFYFLFLRGHGSGGVVIVAARVNRSSRSSSSRRGSFLSLHPRPLLSQS